MQIYLFRKLGSVASSLASAALVMLGVLVLVFLLMRFAPGDPVSLLLGEGSTVQEGAAMRRELGLDIPVWRQLLIYLGDVFTGDFGQSLVYRRPAIDVVIEAVPNTLLLGAVGSLASILLAIPMGVASAIWRNGIADRIIRSIVLITQVVPPFWGAVVLIHIFALNFKLLPTSGTGDWRYLVLPAATLALFQIPILVRTLRSAMLEVLKQDYIRTARAKGLGRWTVIISHGLINALGPIVTVIGMQLGSIFSGAIVTEAVFAWPGLGSLALGALLSRDYALAQAVVAFTALLVVVFNLLADGAVAIFDPRLRNA